MTPEARHHLAEALATARREGRQIQPPPDLPVDAAEGYAVGAEVAALLGWERRGWKIAATTAEMQRRLRASEPIRGPIYARFVTEAPTALDHAALLDPIVECEIVLRLDQDLPMRDAPWSAAEVESAIGAVHGGIEVAECRYPMNALPPMPGILADGSASGRYVLGPPIRDWRRRDLAALPVSLEVDGVIRRTGSGAEAMGHPFRVLLWLAEALRQRGEGLAAGDLICTGTCTGMLLPARGQRHIARFGEDYVVPLDFV